MSYCKCKFIFIAPEKNLRLAIKEAAPASSWKVWRKRQYSILCTFCTNVPVDDLDILKFPFLNPFLNDGKRLKRFKKVCLKDWSKKSNGIKLKPVSFARPAETDGECSSTGMMGFRGINLKRWIGKTLIDNEFNKWEISFKINVPCDFNTLENFLYVLLPCLLPNISS